MPTVRCSIQMRRSPTPWLSEGTAPNRTAAPVIGIPILRLNQLQPGGYTQLHHLNEDVPLQAAVKQRCEHLRVEGIGGHLSNSGLRPCPRMTRTSITTAGLVAYSKAGWHKWLTVHYGAYLASASSLRISGEAPLTMNFVLAHCPDIVGMTPAPPRRQTMRSPSHAPSPSHSLFALR